MIPHELVEWGREALSQGFLGKLAAAAMAGVVAIVGLSRPSVGIRPVACCALCTHDCQEQCPGCWWIWSCCSQGRLFYCMECYQREGGCSGGCDNIFCSQAVQTTIACPSY